MDMALPIAADLDLRIRQAINDALPRVSASIDPLIRHSDHADFQANGVLALAKQLGVNPRELATQVASRLEDDELIATCQVSGPGFLNIMVNDEKILRQAEARVGAPRLGLSPHAENHVTVIDYSQPNIAKEMHVGHLRSTIIGDALARLLEFRGEKVIRQNHLGDWGTQFGMLIQYLSEHPEIDWRGVDTDGGVSRLNELYRTARSAFDSDQEFADRARRRVVELQAGDADTLAQWREIVEESKRYFNLVYSELDVTLTDADAVGESFYNPYLDDVAAELERLGVATRSAGALCVFFDDVKNPDGDPVPLIVQKSDGGFGYAATDLAAIRYRVRKLGATRILYVVDARQALHFKMVFETARRAGWLPDTVEVVHAAFGTVLGSDGKPFKTRSGETVRLISLLEAAVAKARETIVEKNPQLEDALLVDRSRAVGIGAVKYADLATSRTRDYIFDINRMVSLTGNTGVYLQYAHARIRSILAKAKDIELEWATTDDLHVAERRLALKLDELDATLEAVSTNFEPHRLCGYLYGLAGDFTSFYEACPVLNAPTAIRARRLMLCRLTGDTLKLGLQLLGIQAPDRM